MQPTSDVCIVSPPLEALSYLKIDNRGYFLYIPLYIPQEHLSRGDHIETVQAGAASPPHVIMLLLKAISLLCILALAISLVEASVPILWGIQPKNTTCSGAGVYYRKICDGNVVCTYRNTGPCCGGCDSTWCSVCPSGTVCSGKGCTALYSISTYAL